MGLLLTLDDIVGEEVARVGAEEGAAAACSDTSAGKLRVFDLHCDTLDRIAFHGDPTAPGGFAEHDAGVPAEPHGLARRQRRARLACAHGAASRGASASRRSFPTPCGATRPGRCSSACDGVLARELDRCPDKPS